MTAPKTHKRSSSPFAKIGHADYRHWIEEYGWEPDPEQKQREIAKNNAKRTERRLTRKRNGRVMPGPLMLYPSLGKRAGRLCSGAMKRAEFFKIPCDITGNWVLEKLLAGHCEVTGLPFDFTGDCDGPRVSMFAPSLDQIQPRGGYTKDNVQVVVWCYNMAKGAGTDADVLRMAEALVKKKSAQ